MAQRVEFYVLQDTQERARLELACRLAGKAFRQGMQVYLQTESQEQTELLDSMLWSTPPSSFVPHAVYHANALPTEDSIVLVGDLSAPKQWSDLLISLTEGVPECAARFSRVADLIGGDEQQKQIGRARFRTYRERGVEPVTHKI